MQDKNSGERKSTPQSRYEQTSKGKAARKRYAKSEKGRAARKRYLDSEKGRKVAAARDKRRAATPKRQQDLAKYQRESYLRRKAIKLMERSGGTLGLNEAYQLACASYKPRT